MSLLPPVPSVPPAPADPRSVRTRAKLRHALLAECAERPLTDVSVSAVVRRAGVSRAAYYLHYADLQELAVDACADIVAEAVDALHAWRGIPDPAEPPSALMSFFEDVEPHAELYRQLLEPGGGGPLGQVLHRELRARSRAERALANAPEPEFVASAVASAFGGVFADWLHGAIQGTPADIARRSWRLLVHMHRIPW